MIQVTYPGIGLYAQGQPRYEVLNEKGEITFCRYATPEEALQHKLIDTMNWLGTEIQNLQTAINNQ